MKHTWVIERSDIKRVKGFIELHRANRFVKERIKRNLADKKPPIRKAQLWYWMVSCLLTTQQRSGPKSAVNKFIRTKPFPLDLEACLQQSKLERFAKRTLTDFGGLRRTNLIAKEIANNFALLEGGLWQPILDAVNSLRSRHDMRAERDVADFIDETFDGFGPKQARNLLQCLGVSQHEIPIDGRLTKWLNDFGFPVRLSANTLADPNYYKFVLDGVQALCKAAGIVPCIFDAAIFAIADGDGWTTENFSN